MRELSILGVPLLIILHSCRRFREINDNSQMYRFSPHNQHDFGRIAHAKLDVGFIFSCDENKDTLAEFGESSFAKRLAEAFQSDNDIFRLTSKLGMRHSFRERFDGDPRNDAFYDDSKRKKACFIVTIGEFDEPDNGQEKLQDFANADVEREGKQIIKIRSSKLRSRNEKNILDNRLRCNNLKKNTNYISKLY